MKLGVLSDTHLSAPSGIAGAMKHKIRNTRTLEDLRAIVAEHFSDVERILHAGDFVEEGVMEMLQEFAPLEAVRGNMDGYQLQNALPSHRVIELEGFTIGLVHGDGSPQGIVERVRQHFDKVDAIVFGHSHQPLNERRDGILYFNPGSPTDRIFAPYNSIGILELTDTIRGTIIRL